MLNEDVEIVNQLGLHARAAAKFVSTATRFESRITLAKDGKEVDGKSIMSVMMLAASIGSIVQIKTDGPDETEAMEAIKALIADKFGEEQ
ncbi:MAG: HPr family phosphocarrier protein [Oleiphilus sp.]|nr:MAG: HPr family phosphocarrier protein [Oleiphilus sp.]